MLHHAEHISEAPVCRTQVYCVRFINRDSDADDVQMIEAANDGEALEQARSIRLFTTRELWNGHRLVGVIPTIDRAISG